MRWPITIIVLLLVLAVSLGLYRLESEVQQLERELTVATAELADSRRNSRILAAELSFLSQPSRLQALARRHLELRPLAPAQIGTLASLPLKAEGKKTGALKNNSDLKNDRKKARRKVRRGNPPLPGRKPVKTRRGQRIVMASSGERS
ncbi:MAG: hypothetical protein QF384_06815 [Alphaproteobacteria bacterium]|jgi:hypothetical protein|nr:hypothetical protein [Alphaproteobacteria bacterium]